MLVELFFSYTDLYILGNKSPSTSMHDFVFFVLNFDL